MRKKASFFFFLGRFGQIGIVPSQVLKVSKFKFLIVQVIIETSLISTLASACLRQDKKIIHIV